ncbi:uncharacterized protein LOC119857243 isoform X14 [Dermochelys coriacea]|uniref:uncharacterized protein LOC119857243 isoform X14 n=1 Tax=Dermochelys coriacea TaxID=27794 RepID=UPI0018E8B83A|nr:uncharacterized protein LOC119857243 isoform X14 [Dermochelys coriacea]
MVRARGAAAPAFFLLLLLLPSLCGGDTQAGPRGEPGPDAHVPVLSKNKIKSMIKLLNHRIQVLHQKHMMHEPKLSEKQDEVLSTPVNMTDVKDLPESATYPLHQLNHILQTLEDHMEKSESSEKENKTQTPFEGHSRSLQVSDENIEQFKATPVPEPTSITTKENMKDAKLFEFFKAHEGIHDKKKAKAADLKGLLKHIIIACVAVTGLILAVIVLMHIFTSIFPKNKQEPVITNTYNIYKRENPTKDETKSISEIDCKDLKKDTAVVKNQSEHSNLNQLPVRLSTEESKENGKDLKPSEKQPGHNPSSINSPSKRTDERNIILSMSTEPVKCNHSSQMPPNNCSSSEMKTCKNHRTRSRTLKTNQSCCHKPRQHCKEPKEHGYKRLWDKDIALHRKHLNHQRSSRHDKHGSKSTKCNTTHSNCSLLDGCYNDSSPSDDSSSDLFISSDTTAKTHLSEISQHDGSKCTCSQHRMGSCSSDSYSD